MHFCDRPEILWENSGPYWRCGNFLLGLGERWIKIVNYVVTKCILAFKKSVKITKILNEFIVYFGFILTICLTFFVYEGFNDDKSGTFSD